MRPLKERLAEPNVLHGSQHLLPVGSACCDEETALAPNRHPHASRADKENRHSRPLQNLQMAPTHAADEGEAPTS